MSFEKTMRFYCALFSLFAIIAVFVLLPLPIILLFQVSWKWIFLYAAYPPMILIWAYMYGGLVEKLEAKNENHPTIS